MDSDDSPAVSSNGPAVRPLARPDHDSPGGDRVGDPVLPRFRVLVVDDEEDICRLIALTLESRHEVRTANNAMQALEELDRFDPEILMTDLRMPVLNGFNLVDAIRRHPRYLDLPVFYMTAERRRDLAKIAFDHGASYFMSKPMNVAATMRVIDAFATETEMVPRPKTDVAADLMTASDVTPVRFLTIDEDPYTLQLLRDYMHDDPLGEREGLFLNDPLTALGNIGRIQPDVILYNPRNESLSGVTFMRLLRLGNDTVRREIRFIAPDFSEAEEQFSMEQFGHNVIELTRPREVILNSLADLCRHVRSRVSIKHRTPAEIQRENEELSRTRSEREEHRKRQKEFFRKRFDGIQRIVDSIMAQ